MAESPVQNAPADEVPSLDELHITLEQFEDEATYDADGTMVIASLGIRHRCPDGTYCAAASARAMEGATHGIG